jgi:hypothetical protein
MTTLLVTGSSGIFGYDTYKKPAEKARQEVSISNLLINRILPAGVRFPILKMVYLT